MDQQEEVGERRLKIGYASIHNGQIKKILTIKLRSLNWIFQKKGSRKGFKGGKDMLQFVPDEILSRRD